MQNDSSPKPNNTSAQPTSFVLDPDHTPRTAPLTAAQRDYAQLLGRLLAERWEQEKRGEGKQ
jgi:hypothetical protein